MRSVYLVKERIIPIDSLIAIACFCEFFEIFARPFISCLCPYREDLLHLVQPMLGLGPQPFSEKLDNRVGGHKDLKCCHMGTGS